MRRSAKQKWMNEGAAALADAFLSLRDRNEALRFLRDLLTEAEIAEFGRRWKAARMLSRGEPYLRIVTTTGLSSTTVARVARWLRRGMGGYRLVIKRRNSRL